MNAGEFIEAVERFFLDIIGVILPGLAMMAGICYITGGHLVGISELILKKDSGYEWIFLIALAYIIGHAVTSFGFKITGWLENTYKSPLVRQALKSNNDDRWILSFITPETELSKKLESDPIYKAFRRGVAEKIPSLGSEMQGVSGRTWRNLALSLAQEHSHLIYRFTFISLLNLGIATVSIGLLLLWGALLISKGLGAHVSVIGANAALLAFAVLPYFFLERYYNFNRRAFQVPFSMALVKLTDSKQKHADAPRPSAPKLHAPSVYLAGGFHSKWQDTVMSRVRGVNYFDPRTHGLKDKAQYTAWDLEAIRRSDSLFAHFEASNPGGYALALEVGFAKALGKFVILVDAKSPSDANAARYLEMVKQTADVTFETLEEGIQFLEKYYALAKNSGPAE